MEKQEMEMKWKLETETGNELETEMETQPFTCFSPRKIHVLLALFLSIPELSLPPVFDRLFC